MGFRKEVPWLFMCTPPPVFMESLAGNSLFVLQKVLTVQEVLAVLGGSYHMPGRMFLLFRKCLLRRRFLLLFSTMLSAACS